jgi:hypothetical protein
MADLVATLDDEIMVEGKLFGLIDDDGPPEEGPNWLTLGVPATLLTGPNCASFRSAGSDHYAAVRVEAWDSSPPPADQEWPENWSAEPISLSSGSVKLVAVTAASSGRLVRVGPAGRYALGVAVRGRAAAAIPDPAHPIRHGVEHWLLRFWPLTG